MKHDDSLPQIPAATPETSDSRRQFLQSAVAGTVAGALILSRSLPADAQIAAPAAASVDTTLDLSQHPALAKVGGFEIVKVGEARVIVAHTETGFIACSSVCTHKGCDVEYVLADKQLVCPCHGARFDESGKVVKGPARADLKPFAAANTVVIKPG